MQRTLINKNNKQRIFVESFQTFARFWDTRYVLVTCKYENGQIKNSGEIFPHYKSMGDFSRRSKAALTP